MREVPLYNAQSQAILRMLGSEGGSGKESHLHRRSSLKLLASPALDFQVSVEPIRNFWGDAELLERGGAEVGSTPGDTRPFSKSCSDTASVGGAYMVAVLVVIKVSQTPPHFLQVTKLHLLITQGESVSGVAGLPSVDLVLRRSLNHLWLPDLKDCRRPRRGAAGRAGKGRVSFQPMRLGLRGRSPNWWALGGTLTDGPASGGHKSFMQTLDIGLFRGAPF
jgi:hypothetical protein